MGRIKRKLSVRNSSVPIALSHAIDQVVNQKWRGRSIEEFHKGWISEPNHVSDFDWRNSVLSPRFCIAGPRGLQQPEYRLIGDLAKSLVNGAVESTETCFPHELDSFAALTPWRESYASDHLRTRPIGFPRAYRTIAPHPGSPEASYISPINHSGNLAYRCRILPQSFGGRISPDSWGRSVAFIQFVSHKLIYLAADAFVGDVYCDGGAEIAYSGCWRSEQLRRLIGFTTSDKKGQKPAAGLTLLGGRCFSHPRRDSPPPQ